MKTRTALALLAATLATASFADTLPTTVRDGSYVNANGQTLSAPAYGQREDSMARRADVHSQANAAVRDSIAQPMVAEGLRQPSPSLATLRSREAVRMEAAQANRLTYAATSQVVEGLSPAL